MRVISFILCIITFSAALGGCHTVNVTSADELVNNSWYVKNPSEVEARLCFDVESSTADFTITDQNKNVSTISGIFAVDKNTLYITSNELKKTYAFGYEVYKDRLILTYNETDLTLNAAKEKEP